MLKCKRVIIMTLKEKMEMEIAKKINLASGVAQAELDRKGVPKVINEKMTAPARELAAEGAVMLKNNGVLPLNKGTKVSLFSRVSQDWFYVGYGSGGDVNRPYEVSLTEAVRSCEELELNEHLADIYKRWADNNPINHGYWANWPLYYKDMALKEAVASKANNESDVAVVTIGRSAGEDRDCILEKGSYYLTDEEKKVLYTVTKYFDKVIVLLNVGSIIDMSFFEELGDRISALLYVWQGGMESGNAVVDLLCGKVSPSGKLSDTIAKDYHDYPSSDNFGNKAYDEYKEDIFVGYRYFETFEKDKVLYPFGFGLTYTEFKTDFIKARPVDGGIEFDIKVTNTGDYPAKEVVQLYLKKPNGKLGNPSRELCAFAKTNTLKKGESEKLTLFADTYSFTSYDDCGDTGHQFCYVFEEGEYEFYLGDNVRDAEKVFSCFNEKCEVYCELKQAAAPQKSLEILCSREEGGKRVLKIKNTPTQKYDLGARILNHLPEDIPMTGDKGIKLIDVKEGRADMKDCAAQLSLDELEAISRGDYTMDSKLGAKGNAGAFGGVLQSLRDKGIPPIITTDGPSGIRLIASCSLIPIGTLLACSFNTELIEETYKVIAGELKDRGSNVLLGPGINIHRNPLCGRNFEYFSEDPYLTGKMAAACVRGIQSEGGSACPKHFACNNQEYKRTECDSRLSERALREIYLKGFEICINDSKPKNIMTSYNKINGVWGHYNYDLCTTILRGEWGYEGNVMTDWWMKSSKSPEFPIMCDQAYRVRAQVDVLMPGGDRIPKHKPDGTLLASYGKPLGITLGEMQRTAINVLNLVMDVKL